jgi:hypothetical protein
VVKVKKSLSRKNQKVKSSGEDDGGLCPGDVKDDVSGAFLCGESTIVGGLSSFPAGGQKEAIGCAGRHQSPRSQWPDSEWKPSRGQLVGEGFTELIKRYDLMWNWYVHMTFRLGNTKYGSVHPERADALFKRWLDQINKEIFGRNYKKRSDQGALAARSTEIGGKGGLLHFHGLIGRIPDRLQRMEWKENWNGLAGFARIFKYDPNLGGAAYLSKSAYAWKRGEIDFIGPWQQAEKIMRESYRVPEIFAVGELQAIQ